jgi:aminoglycoside phosphotransferase (APT) family kinase protein
MSDNGFRDKLERVLMARIEGCQRLASVARLSGGASQETYRIEIDTADGTRALAMRRAVAGTYNDPALNRPGLKGEAELMRQARNAGVPAPDVYYVLTRDDDLGDGFIMEWVEGEALGARIVRQPEYAELRKTLAYEIGKILARIHQIDARTGPLRDFLVETPPKDFIQQTWDRYISLGTPQPLIDYTARWLLENLREAHELVLVHNDFRTGNFMVSPDEVVAVVDWEAAHIGDPMRDLGWICVNSWRFGGTAPVGGFGSYEELFRGYEEVSGQKIDLDEVKYWQVFGSFWWSTVCMGMVAQFRGGPDASIERASIGRRSSEALVDCVNLMIPGPVDLIEPETPVDLDMPRVDELLGAVSDFLRDEVMTETTGRTNFLTRVSANAIDIAAREQVLLPEHRRRELAALRAFYGSQDDLLTLRWRLVNELRDGSQALDDERLQTFLRDHIVNQIAIDQPKYTGFKQALNPRNVE